MEIGLGLGSNLDHRLAYLREAVTRIAALPGTQILAKAPIYETEPVDVKPEYAHLEYLNTVVIIESTMELTALSDAIHQIEADMGRVREEDRNAPRPIDIDILYAGTLQRADGILDLPHPRWAQRRFVLQPLADVRPNLRLPGEKRKIAEVLKTLPASNITLFRAQQQW
ncbi:MAG: 2-amino-4-hydroxy-6-hydroxymethyldihydropteridine diphosphokinase [bacterium]